AAGSGAVIAGKNLPENWAKPVVDSVLLPAHAATSPPAPRSTYSQTLGYNFPINLPPTLIPNQTFTFDLGGVVPDGDGTVTISNLAGDLSGALEQWTIQVGATAVGTTNNSPADCQPAAGSVFNVSQAVLAAAVSGGNIVITASNSGDIETICATNTMDVTLSFPALG
ncbi:MAG: hypothetical protein ACN4GR_09910, partial [Arenicellales bacterium]